MGHSQKGGRGTDARFKKLVARSSLAWIIVASLALGCSKTPLIPLEAAPLERRAAEGASPVEFELIEVRYVLQADGTYERQERNRYRILDPQGVEYWSHVEAHYAPWYMKRPEITGFTTSPSGKVDHLDPKVLSEQPAYPAAPDLYGDSRNVRGPLPAVSVGSVIETTVTTRTHKPFLAPASMHTVVFASRIPKKKVRLIVDAPRDLPVTFEVREAQVERTEKVEGDRRITTFEGGPYVGLELPEPMLPSDVPYWPQVSFSTGDSWGELAKAYERVVEDRLRGIDFAGTVREIVSDKDDRATKIAKLHAWLKERVRYVGIEFGESAVIPYRPDEVVSRGFGDCKDQATLLVGLLRAAGLSAHVALLRTGPGEDVRPNLPALNVFDHAIVVVEGKEPLWIDPTASWLPVGSLPTGVDSRLALVASSATRDLVQITPATPSSHTYRETRTLQLAEEGKASLIEESQGTGVLDRSLRETFVQAPEEIKKNLKNYLEHVYRTDELGELHYGRAADLLAPFSVRLEGKKTPLGYTSLFEAGAVTSERVLMSWLPEPLVSESKEPRRARFALTLPYRAELTWKVVPPSGFVRDRIPEPLEQDWGKGRFRRTVSEEPRGTVTISTAFEIAGGEWSPAEVEQFKKAYQAWGRGYAPQISFEHEAQKMVRAGDVRGAVTSLQKAARSAPQRGIHAMRLGRLLAPFAWEPALAHARKAVALEPNNAALQRELAILLAQNRVGEDLGVGYDRKGALAAYAEAARLDPEDVGARLREAVILEHDERGERYQSKDLDRAIAIYDELDPNLVREYDDGTFVNNVYFALYWAKRHDELRSRLSQLPRDEVPTVLAVMNEAARTGSAAQAHREAERLNLTGQALTDAMAEASATFVRLRSYGEAVQALELGMSRGNRQAALEKRLRLLRQVRPIDMDRMPENSPEAVAFKILVVSLAREGSGEEVAKALLSRDAQTKKSESKAVELLIERSKTSRTALLSAEVMADIGRAALTAEVEGSDALGYRVKCKQDLGTNVTTMIVYVLKEGGKYKVRAFGDHPSELGAEALTALAKGDKKRAIQWLDWARDSFRAVGGEDPLRLAPFARLWQKGTGDPEVAAAALAVRSDQVEQAVRVLEKALAKASDADRPSLQHALVIGYARLERHDRALPLAEALVQTYPDSETAFWLRQGTLWSLERFADYERGIAARQKLGREKERTTLVESLAGVLVRQGKFTEARAQRQRLIDAKEASADVYNNQAWTGLFVGATPRDLEYAQRAVDIEQNPSRLHTLASVYAELGKLNEASRTLQQLLSQRKDHEPAEEDWFIVGRIAEELGLKDAAKSAYQKVPKPEKDSPTSTYRLAQRRLGNLR